MAVDTSFASLFENLKLEDPWLPPRPWESIPSESGLSHPSTSSSLSRCLYDTSSVSEASLVRLAMNALQGVESALISIEKLCAAFCSEPADRTFHRVHSLWSRTSSTHALGKILKSIGDSGFVVFLLCKFVDYLTPEENEEVNIEANKNRSHPSHSLVNQAFAVAVKKVLEGYNCSMDTLYTSVGLRRSSTNGDRSLGVGVGCLMSIDYSQVTLLEVYLHSKGLRTQIEALGNICHVYDVALCSSISSLEDVSIKERFSNFPRGGDLLTYLYTQLKVSDPVHCALLKFLFLQSFEPYCEFIRSWIYKAKISDPYNEFIVNCVDILLPNSVGNTNIGISIDFPSSTIRERDGVTVPCFLKEFLIPLFRAGQQLQVLMKLLELSDSAGTWNRTYEDFLPYWSGLSNDSLSHTSPLTFSKGGIETIVLARNSYYKKMMEKLEDLPTELDFRHQKVVPHGFPVFPIYSGKSENPPAPCAIDDPLILPATQNTERELLVAVENSEASSTKDEFYYVEDPWDSAECSSINSSEEENQPEKQIELPHNMVVPDQKYFSALSFSSSISSNTSSPNPLKSDNSFTPHFGDPNLSSISETQAHRLLQNPLYIDSDATATTKDQYPSEINDCSVSVESWTFKYNSDFLSMNPIVNKNFLLHRTNKLGETSSSDYRNNLPFLDFTFVKDPFVTCADKLIAKPRYQYGTDRSVLTEPAVGKEGYSCDKVSVDNTKSSYVYSPPKSMVNHRENMSLTTDLCGGNSWESLLGNSRNSADIKNRDQGNSLAIILDIPLDFVMGKYLLEEILLQYRYVSKLTIKLLEEGFNLREHLMALRRYHFMELADWADLFVMNLWNHNWCITEADRRISEIQSFLELSLQRSSCERDNNKDRLFVYMKKQSMMPLSASVAGIHSFDFLGLGYRVDWPVSIVLIPAALKIYGDIFSFLIQVKLSLSSLAEVWCSLKELKHVINQNCHSELHESDVRHFNVLMRLRQQVNHFVATLQQYVHSQLSHVCWSKFQHSLKHKVKDMMDLESVHMAYLTDSLQVCFLSDETRVIASYVQSILQCALDFRYCLIASILEAKLDEGGLQSKLSRINISQVLAIKGMFDKNIKELYQCYHKSPRHVEFGLTGFWDYLNYNGYYSEII